MTCFLEWPAGLSLHLRDKQTSPLRLSDQRISPLTWETSGPLPFAWATNGSLPSLERPADHSPSLERPADLCLRLKVQRTSPLRLSNQPITPFTWETSGPLPFAWATSGSLPSVQNYRLYIVFSSPKRKYEHRLRLTYFLFMAGYRNLHTSVFFPVICWSYLRTEISVTLSIGNKLYSSPSSFIFSFQWPTLLMLSCDRIEPAKFIHSTMTLAKLVYYTYP